MTAASQPHLVTLRSGDVVRIRPIRPDDAPALARAYANLGEQSRYRRFFTAMPALLPSLGHVETESRGPVVTTRVELAEPPRQASPDFLELLTAAARGDIMSLPVLLRRLIKVPEGLAHIVRMPVSTVLKAWRPGPGR
jgi:hypothetical protein